MIAMTRRFWFGTPHLAVNPVSRAFLGAVVLSGLVLTAAPKSVEDVSRATLDNGLRVVIVRSPLALILEPCRGLAKSVSDEAGSRAEPRSHTPKSCRLESGQPT